MKQKKGKNKNSRAVQFDMDRKLHRAEKKA